MTERGGRAATALADVGRRSVDGRLRLGQQVADDNGSSRHRTSGREWPAVLAVDIVALGGPLWWSQSYWRGTVSMGAAALILFAQGELYRRRLHAGFLDELPSLLGRLLVASAAVGVVAAQRHSSAVYVGGFMGVAALSAGMAVVGRAITAKITLVARGRRWVQRRALVVGGGAVASDLASLLRRYPRYGLTVGGSLSTAEPSSPELHPWLGSPDQIEDAIARTRAEVVLLADPGTSEPALRELAQRALFMRCELYLVPVLHTPQHCGGAHDHIGAIPVLRVGRPHLDGPRLAAKRLLDIAAALLSLLITAPILVLCLAAARIECGEGVLFRQTRVGRLGRPFPLLKIRTIRAEVDSDPDTEWSVEDGPRIGPMGRFLRRTSLDELPQLWNILCGDMTLVGPRPERPHFVELFSELHQGYAERHRAPVGLTGLAQVSGLRGDTSIRDRARYDNYYIEHWSMWLDIKVLLRTFGEVIRGGGR